LDGAPEIGLGIEGRTVAMPSRKIPRRGSKKNIGKFPSLKMGKTLWWEALTERDAMFLYEYDRDVSSYEEQPDPIYYILNDKRHRYTPDFRVVRGEQIEIVEVKPKDKLESEGLKEAFAEIARACESEGHKFIVITDELIRVEPKLGNIKMLYRYAMIPILLRHQVLCQEFFESKREGRLEALAEFLDSERIEDPQQTVYALVYHGYLEIDFMKSINLDSVVSLPGPTRNLE
jgi:hypothetical protein